jgi:4'-phosphopantetheinyl transferase
MAQAVQATIWLANLDDLPGELVPDWAASLSAGEQRRFHAFVRAERQRQFVAGRVLLRQALGAVAGVLPDSIVVDEQLARAPAARLADGRPAPFFSISHSGPWVACAASAGAALGLDIEVRDTSRDHAALALQAFGAPRAAQLTAMPDAERLAAFYDMWCREEALFKLGQAAASCHVLDQGPLAIALCASAALAEPPVLRLVGQLTMRGPLES